MLGKVTGERLNACISKFHGLLGRGSSFEGMSSSLCMLLKVYYPFLLAIYCCKGNGILSLSLGRGH